MYKEAIDYLREQASQFVEDSTAQCMNVLVSSAVSKPVSCSTTSRCSVFIAFFNDAICS